MERMATEKHELFDGVVYAMAGASPAYNRITFDLIVKSLPLIERFTPCKNTCLLPKREHVSITIGGGRMAHGTYAPIIWVNMLNLRSSTSNYLSLKSTQTYLSNS